MQVGCLGDIVFNVSSEMIRTVSNFAWSGSARYATHARHGKDALPEFVGLDLDEVSLNIVLVDSLGVEPIEDIKRILEYERSAATLPLVLGEHDYGKWRWVIKSHKVKVDRFDTMGNIASATVTLNLLGYVKE